jgi:galactokinase
VSEAAAVGRLVDLGFEEHDARSRLRLIEAAQRRHAQIVGSACAWTWFVPGRVEMLGKHTDYAGGRSVLAAVPRGFVVAGGPRPDGLVRLHDHGTGETGFIDAAGQTAPSVRGASYVAAVVRRFALNFPGAALGTDVTVASDLPGAAGLSSSSALVVGMAAALTRRGNLEARPEWRAAIRTPYELAEYLGAVERGSDFDRLAGTTAVGVLGGSEDHTAILTCRSGFVRACRYSPVQLLEEVALPADWRFVIAASGVEADKAGSARARYNRASLAAERLLSLWHEHTGRADRTLAEAAASSPDAAVRLTDLAAASGLPDFPGELLMRRLAHFLAEDARVLEVLRAVRDGDRQAVGELSRGSQADAEHLLQNQTEETSALARLAREQGAFAASSFGAGFGGSVWALVSGREARAFGERWLAEYLARYPTRDRAEVFEARPGPGVFEWTG